MIVFKLPFGVSLNNAYPTGRDGKRHASRRARMYRVQVGLSVMEHRSNWIAEKRPVPAFPLKGRLSVTIGAAPPDNNRRDLDNLLKACLDGLQKAGVYEDDSQIDVLQIVRKPRDLLGYLEVSIMEMHA